MILLQNSLEKILQLLILKFLIFYVNLHIVYLDKYILNSEKLASKSILSSIFLDYEIK